MNNKLLAALALTTALATGLQAQCQINSGAYVGLSAGGAHLGGKNDCSLSNNNPLTPQPSSSNKLSANSIAATVFGGYGLKLGSIWCAAEVSYQFDNLVSKDKSKNDANDKDKTLESKSNGAFGGAVHVGVIANNNFAVYAIAGVERRNFRVKFNDEQQNTLCTINKSYASTAFVPGLGFRFNISKNIALKSEYKYALHQSKKFTSDTKANPAGGNETVTVKHAPNVQSFNVGLAYTF